MTKRNYCVISEHFAAHLKELRGTPVEKRWRRWLWLILLQLAIWGQPYSYNWLFKGNHNADMTLSENEFDTPGLEICPTRRQPQKTVFLDLRRYLSNFNVLLELCRLRDSTQRPHLSLNV